MSLKAVALQPVQLYAKPAYDQPGTKFRVTNNSETIPVYLDETPTITATSTPLPQQATVTYNGNRDVWASSLSSTPVLVDVDADSLTWDNPVGVQIALDELGLATAALQNTQMTQGIPPNVPNITSAALDDLTPGTYTLTTFAHASRLWLGHLGLAVATDNTDYASGLMRIYAQFLVGGAVVRTVQCAIGGTGETMESHSDMVFNGLPVAANDAITVNVNGGTGGITGLYITADADVMGSTP
jgi:hypothetical protein